MVQALRSASAFAGATHEALEPMARAMEARTYGVGETLAAEDREDGPMYLIAHGLVDCLAPVGKGHQVRVATLAPGEVFNVLHHIDELPRPFAFVAREGSSVLAMRKETIFQLMRANNLAGSTLRMAMIRSLSDRVNQANATFALAKLMAPDAS
jgi:CRP-like cAMP-binding protein